EAPLCLQGGGHCLCRAERYRLPPRGAEASGRYPQGLRRQLPLRPQGAVDALTAPAECAWPADNPMQDDVQTLWPFQHRIAVIQHEFWIAPCVLNLNVTECWRGTVVTNPAVSSVGGPA